MPSDPRMCRSLLLVAEGEEAAEVVSCIHCVTTLVPMQFHPHSTVSAGLTVAIEVCAAQINTINQQVVFKSQIAFNWYFSLALSTAPRFQKHEYHNSEKRWNVKVSMPDLVNLCLCQTFP